MGNDITGNGVTENDVTGSTLWGPQGSRVHNPIRRFTASPLLRLFLLRLDIFLIPFWVTIFLQTIFPILQLILLLSYNIHNLHLIYTYPILSYSVHTHATYLYRPTIWTSASGASQLSSSNTLILIRTHT